MTPRLITRALQIVETMRPVRRVSAARYKAGARIRIREYALADKRYRELRRILTDLDAREAVVQPSRRKAHGLKPKRKR